MVRGGGLPYEKDEDDVTFEILSQVHRLEKEKGKLSDIKANFYHKAREYISTLREGIKAETERNPSSPRLIMMKDELTRAERDFKRIFDLRQRKILLLANTHSIGSTSKDKNLLPQEKPLFEEILAVLKTGRVGIFEGEKAATKETKEGKPAARPEGDVEDSLEDGEEDDEAEEETEQESEGTIEEYEDKEAPKPYPYTIVQVTEDIPSFATPNRNYILKKEDLVTLPEDIAGLLVKKGTGVIVL